MDDKKYYNKLLTYFIVAFWLVMAGLLIGKEVVLKNKTTAYQPFLSRDTLLTDSWMGIYFNDSPIGFVHSAMEPYMIKKGQSGYLIKNRTLMNLMVLEKRNKVIFDASAIVDEEYQLQDFNFDFSSGMHSISVSGKIINKTELKLRIESQGKVSDKTIRLPDQEGVLIASIISPFSSFGSLKVGNSYNVSVFNPFSLQVEKLRVEVSGKQVIVHDGQEVEAFVVKSSYQGVEQTAWVDENGDILKEETGLGWVLIKETPAVATRTYKDFAKGGVDLTQMMSLPADKDLPVGRMKSLRLSLADVPEDFELENHRQKIIEQTDKKKVIEIIKEKIIPDNILELPVDGYDEYKKSTVFIQSKEPEIEKLSEKIIGKELNSYNAAIKINRWLFKNINKVPVISIPSALDVLNTREGDCNEHSVLFAALARRAGIPTKINVGLAFAQGRFFYHAWVSVYVGQWVDMDPTFGQDIADCAHIKLLEGDITKHLEIIRVLGKIKLEVLSFDD
jgi:hypothetical protein